MTDNTDKKTLFENLVAKAETIIDGDGTLEDKMQRICGLLHENVAVYDWVGFYISDPKVERELYLGPYVGEATDHVRIPFGVGICGQSAETKETFVIDDVNAEDNYLSCSVDVKSEIVVPVLKDGEFVAQIDIDSHTITAMDDIDREALERICAMLARLF